MRQDFKNKNYATAYSDETQFIIDRSLNWLESGKFPEDKIVNIKRGLASWYLKDAISKYTFNFEIQSLTPSVSEAIKFAHEGWDGFWKLKDSKGIELDQYILSAYDEMLWMLSLGYLLNIPNEEFEKLIEIIDRDGVKDELFEFIICAKVPGREKIQKESYRDFFHIPKIFDSLRQAIKKSDNKQAVELIEKFISKDWYTKHKEAGWHNSHKSKHNTYFGYWSIETVAIVSIMKLDDSGFEDSMYYPKDLIS